MLRILETSLHDTDPQIYLVGCTTNQRGRQPYNISYTTAGRPTTRSHRGLARQKNAIIMHPYPTRASLEKLGIEILKLVSRNAAPRQWKEWLRVPLEHAAASGNVDLFNKLLEAGADWAAGGRSSGGRTQLDWAERTLGGNEGVATDLLGTEAQPGAVALSGSPGRSAVCTATSRGHGAVTAAEGLIVTGGADAESEDPVLGERSVPYEASVEAYDRTVNYLAGGADLNAGDVYLRTVYGRTPLRVAAERGHCGLVPTLLLRDEEVDGRERDWETPLMLASKKGHVCVVKTLLAAGAALHHRWCPNSSALHEAASRGHVPVLQAILDHGAENVNNSTHWGGGTALHSAAENDQLGAIDALVEAGADVEMTNTRGSTPLSVAARKSKWKAMAALLRQGANVHARDNHGYTALHAACSTPYGGIAESVDLLLRWGADETALDDSRRTPADIVDGAQSPFDRDSTYSEPNRIRSLLSRAPADKAWRRRGWLLMLRLLPEKDRVVMTCESCKMAREQREGSIDGDRIMLRRTSRAAAVYGGEGSGDDNVGRGGLRQIVERLVGLEQDDVFRTVLSFL